MVPQEEVTISHTFLIIIVLVLSGVLFENMIVFWSEKALWFGDTPVCDSSFEERMGSSASHNEVTNVCSLPLGTTPLGMISVGITTPII